MIGRNGRYGAEHIMDCISFRVARVSLDQIIKTDKEQMKSQIQVMRDNGASL